MSLALMYADWAAPAGFPFRQPRQWPHPLLAAWQEGDVDAHNSQAQTHSPGAQGFDALVASHAPRVYRHLYRIVQNVQEAEDLCQETFLRAYRYFHQYDPARPFLNWVLGIGTRLAFDALRKRGRIEAAGENAAVAGEHVDAREVVERRDVRERLARRVEQLPGNDALLIQLHYSDGLTLREAGEILGMSEGAVKVALCRARKRLRALMMGDAP